MKAEVFQDAFLTALHQVPLGVIVLTGPIPSPSLPPGLSPAKPVNVNVRRARTADRMEPVA